LLYPHVWRTIMTTMLHTTGTLTSTYAAPAVSVARRPLAINDGRRPQFIPTLAERCAR
jgi:hypothetical protein